MMYQGEGDYMVYILDPATALHYQLPIDQMIGDQPRISLSLNSSQRMYYTIREGAYS